MRKILSIVATVAISLSAQAQGGPLGMPRSAPVLNYFDDVNCYPASEREKEMLKPEYLNEECIQRSYDQFLEDGHFVGLMKRTKTKAADMQHIYQKWRAIGVHGAPFEAVKKEFYADVLAGFEFIEFRPATDVLVGNTEEVQPLNTEYEDLYLEASQPPYRGWRTNPNAFSIYKGFQDGSPEFTAQYNSIGAFDCTPIETQIVLESMQGKDASQQSCLLVKIMRERASDRRLRIVHFIYVPVTEQTPNSAKVDAEHRATGSR